ncbi:hypothetical protein BGZ67_003600 [Mortierella alpina]|nr:hypothetical protein BGZ67_003600 [Mortierella alpina]
MEFPGYLTSIQNTADCKLYEYPGCSGRVKSVARGSHDGTGLRDKYVSSFSCSEPGFPRNLAPAVQAAEVQVSYCVEGGPCNDVSVKPNHCNHMEFPGYLTSIQNTADCKLYEYPGCSGRVKSVTRGSHDGAELRDKYVSSFSCSEPGFPRNLAPAVQASAVTVFYCDDEDQCTEQYVEPNECTYLDVSGYLTSIQNTANCELFSLPHCGGRSISVRRGSTDLKRPFVRTIKCSEPGFQRNQRPMRRH